MNRGSGPNNLNSAKHWSSACACTNTIFHKRIGSLYLDVKAHKNGRLEEEGVAPIKAHRPVKIMLKIEHPVTCLATIAHVYAAYTVCVTISALYSGKF